MGCGSLPDDRNKAYELFEAHRVSEQGHVRGKLVLLTGCDGAGEVGGRGRQGTGAGVRGEAV
jgi:hypothetical protein